MTIGSRSQLEEQSEDRVDLRGELDRLELLLAELKVVYEQYFLGILTLAPDRQHNEVKRLFRRLQKSPFRNSSLNYRLKALKHRYATFDTYWQRVLREREQGTYVRDVFKANLRERMALEDEQAGTKKGSAEKSMKALFDSYSQALEKQSGAKPNIDFKVFQKSLIERAKDFKRKNAGKKLAFKIVVKNGKVTVQAKVKE